MSTDAVLISDEQILAALDRAGRHRGRNGEVSARSVYDHLAIPSRSGRARHVYRRLPALQSEGAVERSRRNGVVVWKLTSTGSRRAKRALRRGETVLPESPQHRLWRNARMLAEQEIERFRQELHDCLAEALRLLDADARVHSDVFLDMAERLQSGCRRFATAIHCLYEWAEPDDARADVDERIEPGERRLLREEQERLRSKRLGRRWLGHLKESM